jgi:20S proteasome subunit beta 4
MKQFEDKSRELNSHNLMIFSGEAGDTVQFSEFVQRNIKVYGIRHGIQLSTEACARFTRRELADALRTRVLLLYIP